MSKKNNNKNSMEQAIKLKSQRGITLVALVITIVVTIILAMITINFLFGENGLITKAQEAVQMSKIEDTREKLEMATGTAIIDGKGTTSMDEYIDIIIKEEIVGSTEDVTDDEGDGVYEIITNDGFIFEATPVPDKDNADDIILEYVGLANGPRIKNITATTTTNSATIEVEAVNAENAVYKYEYKKNGESDWQTVEGETGSTCTINNLEENVIYNIRVTVEVTSGGNKGTATREINVRTGEMPTGAITFEQAIWQGDGTASVVVHSSQEGHTIQYQIVATGSVTDPEELEEANWKPVGNGEAVTGIEHNQTVYARLWDGTNGSSYANADIKDTEVPQVSATAGGTTSNSVAVSVQVSDNESGMIESPTYTYSIKQTGEPDSSYTTPSGASNIATNNYTFTGLTKETSYDVKVEVNGDKAGNIGIGYLANQTTGSITGGDEAIQTGAITFGNITWSNNLASITVSTNTNYTIQYQVNGTADDGWETIANGGMIGNLSYPSMVYARLYDGTNYGQYASAGIIDNTNPQDAKITLSSTSVTIGSTVTATVTHIDNESGVEITNSRYVWNTSSGKIGTNESSYAGGTFNSNGEQISTTLNTVKTYYLHVLTVDKAGNKLETVSSGITVRQLVTSVSISPSSATINVGSTRQLTSTISPSNASNKSVTWSSSNSSIASVSSSGLVTAKAPGTVTITATAKDGSGKKGTCSITVNQLVTSISVSPNSVTLKEGETQQLSVTISPSSASNKSLTWSSSNSSVASVSSSGLVTAVAEGTVTITATDGSNIKASCSVTVESAGIPIEDILEEGDWVTYPSTQGNIDCVVLYDNSSSYGIQLITMESVEDVTLGGSNFTTSMNSYNNAISTLNTRASAYNNSTYSTRARCVGSNPSNPTLDNSGYYTSRYDYMENYNGICKDTDTNYLTDYNQMGTLNIRDMKESYWLASRLVNFDPSSTSFDVRDVDAYGYLSHYGLFNVNDNGSSRYHSGTNGIRLCFILKPGIRVIEGIGTSGYPYTLGT